MKQLMKEKGYSFYTLEKLTGIPRSTLNRWANNATKRIPFDESLTICKCLGIDATELFEFEFSIESKRKQLMEMKDSLQLLHGEEREEQEYAISLIEESIEDSEIINMLQLEKEKQAADTKISDLSDEELNSLFMQLIAGKDKDYLLRLASQILEIASKKES